MASQGPFNTTNPSQIDTTGFGVQLVWTNLVNIEALDGSVTTVFNMSPNNPSAVAQAIVCQGYGFSIPANGTILGIQVDVTRFANNQSPGVADFNVQLLKAGVEVGTDKRDNVTLWPTVGADKTYGGPTDLWGTTWTPADINSALFGVQHQIAAGAGTGSGLTNASIDAIQITVFYSAPQNLSGAITLSVTAGFSPSSIETTSGGISLGVTAGFSDTAIARPTGAITLGVTSGFSDNSVLNTGPQNISLGVLGGFIDGPGPISAAIFSLVSGFIPGQHVTDNFAISLGATLGFGTAAQKNVVVPPSVLPPKPPQIDPSQYTSLITNFHNQRPNFMATAQSLVQPSCDLQNQLSYLFALLDIDFAVGDQLDKIGQWIGTSRNLPTALQGVFFSWGTLGLGWGQGVWFNPGGLPADGTLIQTSGGSQNVKYQINLGTTQNGVNYQYAVAIRNFGPNLSVQNGQGSSVIVATGKAIEVIFQQTGDGTSPLVLSFATAVNISDALNFDVSNPFIGPVNGANLIPPNSLNFQGNWAPNSGAVASLTQNQIDPLQPTSLTVLPDDKYRTLLRARIAFNSWNGTVPGIYEIWSIVFALENFQIAIIDNQNMSMTVLLLTTDAIDQVSLALITNGLIVPRPAGVLITGYTQIQAPLFGWGLETPFVQGWGQGNWI